MQATYTSCAARTALGVLLILGCSFGFDPGLLATTNGVQAGGEAGKISKQPFHRRLSILKTKPVEARCCAGFQTSQLIIHA